MYLECQKLLAINMSTLKALYKHIVFLLGKDYITSGKKTIFVYYITVYCHILETVGWVAGLQYRNTVL